ncbi:hypothetical protein ACLESD_23515, partial [Pyxidicoccus sp. 3LFB2]
PEALGRGVEARQEPGEPVARTEAQAVGQGGAEAVAVRSRRRRLWWALAGVSVGGLLMLALASELLAPRSEVVVIDPPERFAPVPPAPPSPTSQPTPPPEDGPHRHFRTAWPDSRGSR